MSYPTSESEREAAILFKKEIQNFRDCVSRELEAAGLCSDVIPTVNGYASREPEIYDMIIRLAKSANLLIHRKKIITVGNTWTLSMYTHRPPKIIGLDNIEQRFEVLCLRFQCGCIREMSMVGIKSDLDDVIASNPEYFDVLRYFSQDGLVEYIRVIYPNIHSNSAWLIYDTVPVVEVIT